MPAVKPDSEGGQVLGVVRVVFGVLVLLRTTPLLAGLEIPYLVGTSPLLGWPEPGWRVVLGSDEASTTELRPTARCAAHAGIAESLS